MKFITQIVGTNFRGSTTVTLLRELPSGTQLTLKRERENQYDKNAIKVMYEGTHLGYVPMKENEALAFSHDSSGGWPKDLTVTLVNKPYILLQWHNAEIEENQND